MVTLRDENGRDMMANDPENTLSSVDRLDEHLRVSPQMSERLLRQLLMELHRRRIVSVDAMQDEAHRRAG